MLNLKCTSCGAALESLGQLPVRSGGKGGGWIFFFDNLAEVGEKVVKFDAYRCTACGHLEFFDLDRSLPEK